MVYTVSEDGKAYQINNRRYNSIGFYNGKLLNQMRKDGIAPQALLLLLLAERNNATVDYIKIDITAGEQWVYIDEILVNPTTEPRR